MSEVPFRCCGVVNEIAKNQCGRQSNTFGYRTFILVLRNNQIESQLVLQVKFRMFVLLTFAISSLGLTKSSVCRLIACIAALLLPVFNDPVDDVDGAGDAVPAVAAI